MKTGTIIVKAEYAGDYKIKITFSDKHVNTFDYRTMVTFDHEEFKEYLDVTKFKKFKIDLYGMTIGWGKYGGEMILHTHTLYHQTRININCWFGKKAIEKNKKALQSIMSKSKFKKLMKQK